MVPVSSVAEKNTPIRSQFVNMVISTHTKLQKQENKK